jgi:hypothetical protein
MKHKKTILSLLAHFHESWMDDEDREEMNRELLRASGKTMEQLNEDFETGIKNGYSIEQQMEIIRRILA